MNGGSKVFDEQQQHLDPTRLRSPLGMDILPVNISDDQSFTRRHAPPEAARPAL
jgi:hypothetical protein